MITKPFTFVTGNPSKAEQLGWHLHLENPPAHAKVDAEEIQSLDLAKVVEHKVRSAYQLLGSPVLVEDISLCFTALGMLPGPLIKWFLQELGNDGLARLVDAYPDRNAVATVAFAYFDGQEVQQFYGETLGSIATEPRGEQGFGWDPVFIPQGSALTWAEMSKEEQMQSSVRRLALEKLSAALYL